MTSESRRTSEAKLSIHDDLRRVLGSLKCETRSLGSSIAYTHEVNSDIVIVGWIGWPTRAELVQILQDAISRYPFCDVMTFTPYQDIRDANLTSEVCLGTEFVLVECELSMLTSSKTRLRPVQRRSELAELHTELVVDDRYTIDFLREWDGYQAIRSTPVLGRYDENEKVIGYVVVHGAYDGVAWLRRLFVSPAHRGHGVGKELLNGGLQYARTRGFQRATGLVPEALWQIGLHKEVGFRKLRRIWSAIFRTPISES